MSKFQSYAVSFRGAAKRRARNDQVAQMIDFIESFHQTGLRRVEKLTEAFYFPSLGNISTIF
jgi:hypothetical protein